MKSRNGSAAAAFILLAVSAFAGPAAPPLPAGFPAGIELPAKTHGESAITALGNRLPEIAAFYRKSPNELRDLFRSDHSLWADPQGRLFYVCDQKPDESPVTGQSVDTVGVAPFPPEMAFRLHSRPGASKVIYLDFDGHDASTTIWGTDAIARPFDIDGIPGNFSATERDRIIYIWQRVAADYAMYEIDVTTEDPGLEALRKTSTGDANFGIRVGIGGSSADWYGSAGGVAYVGSFDDNTDLPCWVFPKSLGPDNEKYIAEAISHEVGHTLGLSHDGRSSPVEGYYQGQGNWAPIMGVGYYKPIVQWSKGEYANANQTQDDLTVMLSYGAAYRADDHGNNITAATSLQGVQINTRGTIETAADIDFFSFTTGDGPITITVNRAPRDSNLRIQTALYDSSGTLLQVTNSADTSSGTQPVTLKATLPAGTYAFSVEGIGNGDPVTTGYSDYASLGEFLVAVNLPADSTWLPVVGGAYYFWLDPANWTSGIVPNGIGATHRFNNNIVRDQTITLSTPLTLGKLIIGDSDNSHGFTLQSDGPSLRFAAPTNQAVISKVGGASDTILCPLLLGSDLLVTNSTISPLALSGGINGPGTLVKRGSGPLVLGGSLSHTGGLKVDEGAVTLSAETQISGPVSLNENGILDVQALADGFVLATGQGLSGSGRIIGPVTCGSGGRLQPGGATAGTLTFSNNLVLENGATLELDLAASDTPGGNTNDLLVVGGDLTLGATVLVEMRFLSTLPASPGNYTIIRYSGILGGSAANLIPVNHTNRFNYSFDASTPGEIHLLVSGMPQNLTWSGDGVSNLWDANNTLNWQLGGSPETFQQLDAVVFDDTGSLAPSINLSGVLLPGNLTVTTTNDLTLTGLGRLSGAMALSKSGSGTLTLANANDFTGSISVSSGVLKPANALALGATNGATIITNGGRLDVNGLNLGDEPIRVAGGGAGGTGVIVNNSASSQTRALRNVSLIGDSTFGGNTRWDIRANPTANLSGSFNLTKAGTNEIWLVDLGTTQLKDITLLQGTLGIQDTTTLGLAANSLYLESGAALALWNTDNNSLSKKLVCDGGILRSDAGDNLFSGTAVLNSNTTISVSSIFEMQGVISGTANLTKTGAGTLSLTAANTFTGAVTVAAGTLRAGNAAALGTTNGSTTIASDARLDLAGYNLGAEPIIATGDGLGNAGAIINYGSSQQNALRFVTLTGSTTFGGISRWDIRANPTGALVGNNQALTKRGPNEIWLVNLGESGLGSITVAEGLLGFQGTTTLGTPASSLTVSSGTSLGIYATGTNALAKAAALSTARIYNGNGSNVFVGAGSLSGSNAFDIVAASALNWRGPLTGSGTIYNVTAGTLILSGTNSYTGATVVNAGTLQIGDGGGTGTPGTATITNNATLVFNRTNDLTVANLITGSGTLTKLGAGILTLTSANAFTGNVTNNALNAGILRLRHGAALGVGPKTINLKSSGSPNSAGSFGIEIENNITLGPEFSWLISNDGLANSPNIPALRNRSGNNTIAGSLLLQTGGGGARITSDSGSTLTLSGPVTTDVAGGRDLFLDGAGSGVFSGLIQNGSSATMFVNVQKEGTGTWTFGGTNSSGGLTAVKAGTLLLTGATGTNSLSVSNSATLRGTGLIGGRTVVAGTLAPGTAGSLGTLVLNNTLTLNGTAVFRTSKSPNLANDAVRGLTSVTYGGILTVSHSGNALTAGDGFQFFAAGAYQGTFASFNLPPLTPGLVWSNRLAFDGSLTVATVSSPTIHPETLGGTNVAMKFSSEMGATYVLQGAASLEKPVTWTSLSTNLGTGGVIEISLPVVTGETVRYFRVMAY